MRRRENGTRGTDTAAPTTPARSIVVVDDDVVVPMTLTIALPQTRVIEASRRIPGFETIRTVQPDAIVIDRRMPDGDGLALVRTVRSDPTTCDIPIVVLTAGYDEADRPEVMEAGADAYLAKPFDPDELLAVVEGLIEGRPPRSARPVPAPSEAAAPVEGNGRAHRRAPLRAATRSAGGTGLPAPGGRSMVEPVAQGLPSPTKDTVDAVALGVPVAQGLPVPTKVTVDAVALGATVARAEQRSAVAAAEATNLQAALEEAQADNRRLHGLVTTLEAKLADAGATGSVLWAPDIAESTPDLSGRLAEAEAEVEQLRAELAEVRRTADEVDQLRRELGRAYEEIEVLGQRSDAPTAGQRLTRKAATPGPTTPAKPAAATGRTARKPRTRAPRQS